MSARRGGGGSNSLLGAATILGDLLNPGTPSARPAVPAAPAAPPTSGATSLEFQFRQEVARRLQGAVLIEIFVLAAREAHELLRLVGEREQPLAIGRSE